MNGRVQTVLTYAELSELLGQTERGPIEAVVADPVRRQVQTIFAGPGPDGIEPWAAVPFYAIQSSPPSSHTSDGSPESTSAAENH